MSDQASPFHAGELDVQERMGVRERIEPWARKVIRDFLPDEHRRFYEEQSFLVAAGRDESDRPWVTLLADGPGFIRSPDAKTLELNTELAVGDALSEAFVEGADIGVLGIEFATRRRNRVNGRVKQGPDGIRSLVVDQAFGNCPQYIHEREWEPAPAATDPKSQSHSEKMDVLDATATRWIESADTFFIASGHRAEGEAAHYGMDASHRGGDPGFVRVEDERSLVFPDYAGNNHYNTIGNLVVDPRVGLLFVDFENGDMLQLTGRATIDWDSAALDDFPGAHRLVRIEIEAIVRLENALPIRWKTTAGAVRSLRLAEKRKESEDVTSFMLVSRDGGALPDFRPGQHLPVEIPIAGHTRRVRRTYSLSAAPDADAYRLTIKREENGLVSRFLHDDLELGDLISARSPAGVFTLRPGTRPVVLLSAGVGVTPMTSMLGRLAESTEGRDVWFIHGARDGAHHPLAQEVRDQAASAPRLRTHVAYSRPRTEDYEGLHFDSVGRIDGDLIASLLTHFDADYYLCGPIEFMSSVHSDLERLGVPEEQIHSETFGPAGSA